MKKNNYHKNYFKTFIRVLDNLELNKLNLLMNKIKKIKKNKILIFGNGAGASIASHFANDLTNVAKIKTISFDNTALITCFANDYGYENWVKKTIEYYADKKDLIIILSASGNSQNMINAAKFCKKKNIDFFSITGFKKNNKLNKISASHIWINSKSYNFVEATQLLILLSLVDRLAIK